MSGKALLLALAALAPAACGAPLAESSEEDVSSASQAVINGPPGGESIAIVANINQRYVTAPNAGQSSLIAGADQVYASESFQIVDRGGGNVAFKSLASGLYVTAWNAGQSPLAASVDHVDTWETFRWVDLGNGDFALVSLANGLYVTADSAGQGPLVAKGTGIGSWERFHWRPTPTPVDATRSPISIVATINGRHVSATSAQNPLVSDHLQASATELFQVVDQGDGNVALRSLASGLYVTAWNAGQSPLTASVDHVSTWETFRWVDLGNGDFALRSLANGLYVTADSAGQGPLVAKGTGIGSWERFHWAAGRVPTLATLNPISIIARANGQYVSAEDGGQSPLLADRPHAFEWESFMLVDLGKGQVAIKSLANGRYVSVTGFDSGPLVAVADQITSREAFTWVGMGNNDFALRAVSNGRYVTAENGGQGALVANRTTVDAWETFHWDMNDGLARQFAPRLRFDGAGHGYPMSAQTFYDAKIVGGSADRLENDDPASLSTGQLPTYYQLQECGNQVRIKYWWFYGHQPACDGTSGSHEGDWENVVVTLSESRSSIAAVTFSMHGHTYTRLAARGGFEVEDGTHPVVYVAKNSHASIYEEGGSSTSCLPWEEFRNNSTGTHLDSWSNLVSIEGDGEPWIVADRRGDFIWGDIGNHPTLGGPTCTMNAADWSDGVPTWWHSQCKIGDRDDGTSCHTQCRPGYTDMGFTCTNWSTWDTYGQYVYGYDYTLPTSDLGLLANDYH